MIAEPTHEVLHAVQAPPNPDRSMHVLELSIAGVSILVSLLLFLAR